MSESVGRAGFNVRHLRHGESGTRKDRASILRESMRELDDEAAAYWAAENPNIVADDTRLNVAMVNDGQGGFRRAKSTAEVLAYGDARIGTKQNPKGEDRVGDTGRKWNPKSFETTLIVIALPRSMCVEIPNVYALHDNDGNPVTDDAGNPVMRSRWVPRDRDEALRYFAQSVEFLGSDVLPGGHDAMHGYDVNLDEAYPHIQIMADTLAADPKNPGQLRVAAQQAWGVSREVLDHRGKIEQPQAKMTRYQKAYREHMHGLGYEVELEASERSKSSHTREEWAALKERERIAEALDDQLAADEELNAKLGKKLASRAADLDARESAVAEGERAAAADRLAAQDERREAEALNAAQRVEIAHLRALREDVERDLAAAGPAPQPPSYDDMRAELLGEQSAVMTKYLKRMRRNDGTTMFDDFERFAREEHAKLTRQRQPVGKYETWRDRTAAAQKKLTMSQVNDAPESPSQREQGRDYGE